MSAPGALMKRREVGPPIDSSLAAEIGDSRAFKTAGRSPRAQAGAPTTLQHSSGGKPILLGISKRGDAYLRTLLIHGARAVMRTADRHEDAIARWARTVKAGLWLITSSASHHRLLVSRSRDGSTDQIDALRGSIHVRLNIAFKWHDSHGRPRCTPSSSKPVNM
jgi:hypothetical protein